jgi:hypothetical protein
VVGAPRNSTASGTTWTRERHSRSLEVHSDRVKGILRQWLCDDVVYRVAPGAATVVQRSADALARDRASRVHVRPYPPPTLAAVA